MHKKDWNHFYHLLKSHAGGQGFNGEIDFDHIKGPLGKWCQRQKNAFKNNSLSAYQIKLLLSLNFPLPVETANWEKRKNSFTTKDKILFANWLWQFENLRKLLQSKPNPFPKTTVRFPGTNKLGRWINGQNERYKAGKLEPERFQLLKSIKFPFRETPTREVAWQSQFHHIKAYRLKYPQRWPSQAEEFPIGNRLGAWLRVQRGLWIQGKLPEKRALLFQSLGVPKEIRSPEWMRKYETLKKFAHMHLWRFPSLDEEFPKGNKLGRWAQKQRQFHKTGWLSEEKRSLLNSIGFPWKVQPDNWQQQYMLLQKFLKKQDRFPRYDEKFPAGNFLGRWVCHQRDLHKAGKLESDRHADLEKLGFIWDPKNDEWMQYFNILRKYLRKYDRIPARHEQYTTGFKIGSWVKGQKDQEKKGLLSAERKRLLEDVGIIWPSPSRKLR